MFLCVESLDVHTAEDVYACVCMTYMMEEVNNWFFPIQYSLLIKYKSTEILADKSAPGSTLRAA